MQREVIMEKDEEETTYVESVMKQWQKNCNLYSTLLSTKMYSCPLHCMSFTYARNSKKNENWVDISCSKCLKTWSVCKICPTMRKPMLDKKAKLRHIKHYYRLKEDEKKILDYLEVDDQAELVCEEILEDNHDEVAEAVIVCDK
eukprot:14086238-Ditylum_brightwellii.AAC.1